MRVQRVDNGYNASPYPDSEQANYYDNLRNFEIVFMTRLQESLLTTYYLYVDYIDLSIHVLFHWKL